MNKKNMMPDQTFIFDYDKKLHRYPMKAVMEAAKTVIFLINDYSLHYTGMPAAADLKYTYYADNIYRKYAATAIFDPATKKVIVTLKLIYIDPAYNHM